MFIVMSLIPKSIQPASKMIKNPALALSTQADMYLLTLLFISCIKTLYNRDSTDLYSWTVVYLN